MSVDVVQKGVLYTKEIQEVGLFAVMTDSRLFSMFAGSPLYFIMMPMIGLLLTALALINAYQLVKASNRNFDKWFAFIVSATGAALASVSLYGAPIATALGTTFAAGSWFFLGSVVLACAHQSVMLALNGFRAYESPKGSVQRWHYIQASVNNASNIGLLLAIIGAAVFVMLTPVAPVAGTVFSALAVALTLGNIAWRLLPSNWKKGIKHFLKIGKPELVEQDSSDLSLQRSDLMQVEEAEPVHSRLFSTPDYSSRVKMLSAEEGTKYLNEVFAVKSHPLVVKNPCLSELESVVSDDHQVVSKEGLIKRYPSAFQCFWAEKSETEQLVDAVIVLQDKRQNERSNQMWV